RRQRPGRRRRAAPRRALRLVGAGRDDRRGAAAAAGDKRQHSGDAARRLLPATATATATATAGEWRGYREGAGADAAVDAPLAAHTDPERAEPGSEAHGTLTSRRRRTGPCTPWPDPASPGRSPSSRRTALRRCCRPTAQPMPPPPAAGRLRRCPGRLT